MNTEILSISRARTVLLAILLAAFLTVVAVPTGAVAATDIPDVEIPNNGGGSEPPLGGPSDPDPIGSNPSDTGSPSGEGGGGAGTQQTDYNPWKPLGKRPVSPIED